MPRTLAPRLRQLLERANPNVATIVELAVPDVAKVLRRSEDLLGVTFAPSASAVASSTGGLTLASTAAAIVTQMTPNGSFGIPQEQGGDLLHRTVGWKMTPGFSGAVLRGVTVRLRYDKAATEYAAALGSGFTAAQALVRAARYTPDVLLQVYRVHRQAGVFTRGTGSSAVKTDGVQVTFVKQLAQPIARRFVDLGFAGGVYEGDVSFDLTTSRLELTPIVAPAGPAEAADDPEYLIEISTNQDFAGDLVRWFRDTTSARSIVGVGDVREVVWQRASYGNAGTPWVRTEPGNALTVRLDVEQFVATSQAVYPITLPALPQPASTGRVVLNVGDPVGTSAAVELSTAGVAGPWTAVANGAVVTPAQLAYHLRLTMSASADAKRAPLVSALGIEFRTPVDLSAEATVEPMTQEVAVPFLAASVGEGRITAVRAGRRDYRDTASDIAVGQADTQLEADIFLASRHPAVTRADWFQTARAVVSGRYPTPTSEAFTLLSLAKTLKRKIPARVESINNVHTVVGVATTAQVQVTPVLGGATAAGNEYDGQGYYLRIRKTASAGLAVGQIVTIEGNTGTALLDFIATPLSGVFAAGDEIEVHSGQFGQPALTWIDQDPADVWLDILTVHLQVPSDRIGRSDIGLSGRAGRPPKVTDIAPGDSATQAKRKVTLKLTGAESGDALLDQLSVLMGGATIEIAGQIVFRQIYPLRDGLGRISVRPEPSSVVFDPRDYSGLDTPTGREQRITALACDYGVDSTAGAQAAVSTTQYVDADALAELGTQDIEGLGFAAVPDEIARWCFNSADQGLFLATEVTQQIVQAASTGLRVWPWTAVDAHPELTVGDTVTVITDQYTDYDPATRSPVRGWNAYPLTLVGASSDGRRFRGFLQGLRDVTAVRVRGGVGTLADTDASSDRAALYDVTTEEVGAQTIVHFSRGSAVTEVWAACAVVTAAGGDADYDYDALVAPYVTPLADAATSFTVPRPGDGQVTLVQLEPRLSDLAAGPVRRLAITATPQVPHVELDDLETATTGTQWWAITERGIPVASVQVQTQVGADTISAFVAPMRSAGAASVVRGGLLGAGEYEHDVLLDATRSSWIMPRLTLNNGSAPIVLGPFAFDRDKNPNIVSVIVVSDRKVAITSDVDTKSLTIFEGAAPWVAGRWKATFDGLAGTVDVAVTDVNGVAGLGSAASKLYTVIAYAAPSGYVDGATPYDTRTLTVSGATAAAAASLWDSVYATAPFAPTSGTGLDTVTLQLKATAAPVGWTVKVYYGADPLGGSPDPTTDITASLSPALSAPPTALTSYTYGTGYPATRAINADTVTVRLRVDLLDGSSVVQDTRTVQASWRYPT